MKPIFTLILLLVSAMFFSISVAQAQEVSPCDTSGYSLSLSVNSVSCPGAATGVATVASTGCTCMFSGCIFTWSNGQIGHTATGLQAGVHGVTVTHPNGCILDTTVTITEPSYFVQSITKQDPTCYSMGNGTATVISSADSGPLTYKWSTGDSLTASLDNLAAGKYFVTTTNFINCSLIDSIVLTEPPALNSTTSILPSCAATATGDVSMNISGGTAPYSCLWSNGANTESLSDIAPGTYQVSITDANDCTTQQSVTVAALPSPQPAITTFNTLICVGSSTQLIATVPGGGTFSWSPAVGLSNPNVNAPIASPNETTTYTVTATAPNGCIGTTQVTITVQVCSDIAPVSTESVWYIFPNPVSELLSVSTPLRGKIDITIRLYNMLGQIVYNNTYRQQNGQFDTQINMAHLPQGNYVLEAQTGSEIYRRQVIKQ